MTLHELQKRLGLPLDDYRTWVDKGGHGAAMRLREGYHKRLTVFLAMMGNPIADVLKRIELEEDDLMCNFDVGVLDYFQWARIALYPVDTTHVRRVSHEIKRELNAQGTDVNEFIYKLHKTDETQY